LQHFSLSRDTLPKRMPVLCGAVVSYPLQHVMQSCRHPVVDHIPTYQRIGCAAVDNEAAGIDVLGSCADTETQGDQECSPRHARHAWLLCTGAFSCSVDCYPGNCVMHAAASRECIDVIPPSSACESVHPLATGCTGLSE